LKLENSTKSNFFVKILMMKKQYFKVLFLVGSLFFFFAGNVQAQADSAKAAKLKVQLIDTICKCVSQMDTSGIKTSEDAQGVLMKCFMGNGMSLFMDYTTASGVDMSDMTAMQDLAKKIGIELTVSCPSMMKLAMKVAKDSPEYQKMMQDGKDSTQPAGKAPAQKSL
jgi:hypothetical protein